MEGDTYDKKLDNIHDFLKRFMDMLHHAANCPIWISYSLKIVEEIYITIQIMWTDMLVEKHNYTNKEKQEKIIALYDTVKQQLKKVRERPFYNVLA
jgi:ABC-type Zn2+ transport system substrate-binding protein/surface adhesin